MKKHLTILFILILLLTPFLPSSSMGHKSLTNNVIYVDDDNINGPWDGSIEHPFLSIQDAIDQSEDQDQIFVFNGTYGGNIQVNKSITIQGENPKKTVIDVSYDLWGIYVNYDICKDDDLEVNIMGFTIQKSEYPYSGMMIKASNTNIENCIFKNNEFNGICFQDNWNNSIFDSEFLNNGIGLNLDNSHSNVVYNNFFNSDFGIYLNSDENNIMNNDFFHCGIDYSSTSENNTILNNTVNNKPLIYLDEKKDMIIENAGQIILEDCENITIKNTDLKNASIGIQLFHSDGCLIESNDLSDNWVGLTMMYSHNNHIKENNICKVRVMGIDIYISHFNLYENNNIEEFYYFGIYLDYSWKNEINENSIKSDRDGYGIYGYHSIYNHLTNNTISSCLNGIYLNLWCNYTTIINNSISSCKMMGFETWNCSHITFSSNKIINNNVGVKLIDSDHILINYNKISNNGGGISSFSTLNFEFENNIIKNNSKSGVSSDFSQGIIKRNIFKNNWADNFIYGTYQVLISKNDYIDHNKNLHFIKLNNKPDLIQYDGNYWDDWPLNLPRPILGMRFLPIAIAIPVPAFKMDQNPSKDPLNNDSEISIKMMKTSSSLLKQIEEINLSNLVTIQTKESYENDYLKDKSLIEYIFNETIKPYNEKHIELESVFSYLSNIHNADIAIQWLPHHPK